MAIRNYLHNQKGQILIESIFLVLIVSIILVIFKQLIEFQKSRQHYRFSKNPSVLKNIRELPHVAKPTANHAE